MKAKKSANSKVPSRALHAKSRKDSCTNNVHPDVILDADEALRYILGRLTKLEDEVAPIKIENKELKKRNGYLESQPQTQFEVVDPTGFAQEPFLIHAPCERDGGERTPFVVDAETRRTVDADSDVQQVTIHERILCAGHERDEVVLVVGAFGFARELAVGDEVRPFVD